MLRKHLMNLYVLQELGILLGGCLVVKNYWELLTGDDGVGVRVSFLVLSFSATNYYNPNLFSKALPFSGQGPEPITLLSPQGLRQLPDPSPMDHPRILQR